MPFIRRHLTCSRSLGVPPAATSGAGYGPALAPSPQRTRVSSYRFFRAGGRGLRRPGSPQLAPPSPVFSPFGASAQRLCYATKFMQLNTALTTRLNPLRDQTKPSLNPMGVKSPVPRPTRPAARTFYTSHTLTGRDSMRFALVATHRRCFRSSALLPPLAPPQLRSLRAPHQTPTADAVRKGLFWG